ncbi:hypothetical protein [Dysosmobacter sp.]|jgi:hypothetical protein|uniref:hypothetical protein n=1 Tax=Dysosmobacter sp. TaxID=2591382 RepID=UPI003D8A4F52
MERQIDLLPYLEGIVRRNTLHYQSDFRLDCAKLQSAARESDMENRCFYWMSRPHGTWMVLERDVFLKGTEGHIIWTYHEYESEKIEARRIVITGHRGKTIIGNVFPVQYREQVRRIRQAALPVQTVALTFTSGHQLTLPYDEFTGNMARITAQYGAVDRIRYAPESEAELCRMMMLEHRFERGWKRKPHTPAQPAPSR